MCSNVGVRVEEPTGFPSPAQDYYHGSVSLDKRFIRHPSSTFLLRVSGPGLVSSGIFDGDIVLVDRSLPAHPGLLLIVVIDGEHRLGWWSTIRGRACLSTDVGTVALRKEDRAWGVVIAAVHDFLRRTVL